MRTRHFSINKILLFLLAFPFLSFGQEIGDSTIFIRTTNLVENQKATNLNQNKSSAILFFKNLTDEEIAVSFSTDVDPKTFTGYITYSPDCQTEGNKCQEVKIEDIQIDLNIRAKLETENENYIFYNSLNALGNVRIKGKATMYWPPYQELNFDDTNNLENVGCEGQIVYSKQLKRVIRTVLELPIGSNKTYAYRLIQNYGNGIDTLMLRVALPSGWWFTFPNDLYRVYPAIVKDNKIMAGFTYKDIGLKGSYEWIIKYQFNDHSDPGLNQEIVSYLWDFGDGETSTAKDPIHIYEKGGSYTVTHSVTNSDNLSDTIIINNCVCDNGFRPNIDGWGLQNSKTDIWPENHWKQFDYKNSFKTNRTWINTFGSVDKFPADSIFPDWFLFSEIFYHGLNYYDLNSSRLILEDWIGKYDKWGGSCFGFSTSSLLYNYDGSQQVSDLGLSDNLFQLNPNDEYKNTGRDIINSYQFYQWDKTHSEFADKTYQKSVNENVIDLQNSYNHSPDNVSLSIKLDIKTQKETIIGWHSVVPYKIITNTEDTSILYIFIDDSNISPINRESQADNWIITINKKEGKWYHDKYRKNGCDFEFFLWDPISNYSNIPIIKSSTAITLMKILNSTQNDIIINNDINDSLGYSNTTLYNDVKFGHKIHITEPFNTNTKPKGYYIDYGEYKAILNNFETSDTRFSVFADSISFFYKRFNVSKEDKDILLFGLDYFKVVNTDDSIKSFNFSCVFNQEEYERVYDFVDVNISPKDTIAFYFANSSEVKMTTLDSASSYIFRANILTQTKADFYPDKNVSVEANTTQTIIPNWADINDSGIIVKVDNGSDGIVDETLNLNNFTKISSQEQKLLATVYPNPSSGKFKIECGEAVNNAFISVYDMRGTQILNKQVRNLQGKWSFDVDLTSFSNGVYLLKIVTDKKVFEKILIKN